MKLEKKEEITEIKKEVPPPKLLTEEEIEAYKTELEELNLRVIDLNKNLVILKEKYDDINSEYIKAGQKIGEVWRFGAMPPYSQEYKNAQEYYDECLNRYRPAIWALNVAKENLSLSLNRAKYIRNTLINDKRYKRMLEVREKEREEEEKAKKKKSKKKKSKKKEHLNP